MGEGSTGIPLEDLKRTSAIREAKITLTWVGVHLVNSGIPKDSPALERVREALRAVGALEPARVAR